MGAGSRSLDMSGRSDIDRDIQSQVDRDREKQGNCTQSVDLSERAGGVILLFSICLGRIPEPSNATGCVIFDHVSLFLNIEVFVASLNMEMMIKPPQRVIGEMR